MQTAVLGVLLFRVNLTQELLTVYADNNAGGSERFGMPLSCREFTLEKGKCINLVTSEQNGSHQQSSSSRKHLLAAVCLH